MDGQTEYQIDLKQILTLLLRRSPVIVAFMLILGLAAFIYSSFFATPIYQATASFHVNNQQGLSSSTKVQGPDITTARMLVNSYINMIHTDLVMDEVANAANASGVGYTSNQIKRMVAATDMDDEAPLFMIAVNNPDPEVAQLIANIIADVAPGLIQGIVKGSEAVIVDRAKLPEYPVSPNVRRTTLIGLIIGFILGAVLVLAREALDTRIKTGEYLSQKYGDVPILGVIPNISTGSARKQETKERGTAQ
ncbi:MAG: hypothetical protein J1F63_01985 [Oscillospiraceae bacterium]|nr:hypothetical protein [Oscillospiraceae bacterium]